MLADHMINPDPSWLKGTQLFLMYKTTKKPVVDNTQDESRKHEVTVNLPPTHTKTKQPTMEHFHSKDYEGIKLLSYNSGIKFQVKHKLT